jgi:hypothetical protein
LSVVAVVLHSMIFSLIRVVMGTVKEAVVTIPSGQAQVLLAGQHGETVVARHLVVLMAVTLRISISTWVLMAETAPFNQVVQVAVVQVAVAVVQVAVQARMVGLVATLAQQHSMTTLHG